MASLVARTGLAGLDTLSTERRAQAAADLQCPEDDYYREFVKEMGDMGGHGPSSDTTSAKTRMDRMYQAQCVKDETMGESVAKAWKPGRLVIHYNGSFHTDFGLGTAARAERRLGKPKTIVVTAVPVENLDHRRAEQGGAEASGLSAVRARAAQDPWRRPLNPSPCPIPPRD